MRPVSKTGIPAPCSQFAKPSQAPEPRISLKELVSAFCVVDIVDAQTMQRLGKGNEKAEKANMATAVRFPLSDASARLERRAAF